MSFDIEMVWEGVRLHLSSSINENGTVVYPNGGGIDDQPTLFWEMVNIADNSLRQYKLDREEHEQLNNSQGE